MWDALLWFGIGWWVGSNRALGQPIIPPNVANAGSAQDAAAAAAEDVTAAIQQQASGGDDTGAAPAPLVASDQMAPGTTVGATIRNTGLLVNNKPVCVDSFMNLVDCQTGNPLTDDEAQIIINTLQPVGAQGAPAPVVSSDQVYQPMQGYARYGHRR